MGACLTVFSVLDVIIDFCFLFSFILSSYLVPVTSFICNPACKNPNMTVSQSLVCLPYPVGPNNALNDLRKHNERLASAFIPSNSVLLNPSITQSPRLS
jgi:hypothetical protein